MSNEKIALFTIFGGTGDLAQRKLYPSLFKLYQRAISRTTLPLLGRLGVLGLMITIMKLLVTP